MKFSDINFNFVSKYLVSVTDEDRIEIETYIAAAKSFVMSYTFLDKDKLDENEYFVMPTLMLISHFYENKTVELQGKNTSIFTSMLNLGKLYNL